MTNYQRTKNWLTACGKTQTPENLSVGVGVDLEEIGEYLRCLRVDSDGWQRVLERALIDLEDLAKEIKTGKRIAHIPNHLRVEALDAIADREVTANGVAFFAGFDKDSADAEVLRSNDSKLEDGKAVLAPGGKIMKGRNYSAPDLKGFV